MLEAIDSKFASYRRVPEWKKLQQPNASTAFSTLFGQAFRQRTRDLVQFSFVDALDGVKKEFRECIDSSRNLSKIGSPLQFVGFYDYFDPIHEKVSGLESSQLDRVLVEEYVRTLLRFVLFVEDEYPWQRRNDSKLPSRRQPYFLKVCSILTAALSDFPPRLATLFEKSINAKSNTSKTDSEESERRSIFQQFASDGRLQSSELCEALKVSSFGCDHVDSIV